MRRLVLLIAFVLCSLGLGTMPAPIALAAPQGPSGADSSKEPLKIIRPEDAKEYDGKEVTVEFKVAASFEAADKGVCFLNSVKDRDNPKQFTAFINHDALLKFRQDSKTAKPADYFKAKKVRVSGTIKPYQGRYEIEVAAPGQIKIVTEENSAASP
jgi:hypothetical protein